MSQGGDIRQRERQRWKLRCVSHESDQSDLPMKHREQQHPFGAQEAALFPLRHPGRHPMTRNDTETSTPLSLDNFPFSSDFYCAFGFTKKWYLIFLPTSI